MSRFRWVVVALAAFEAGWMVFDGARALVVGDYVTPASGELGPWAALAEAVGVPPRSTGMKAFFVAYGAGWLVVTAAYAAGRRRARPAMVAAAAASLWYLVVGTVVSVLILLFLLFGEIARRAAPAPRDLPEHRGS
jgi:hypothetical protein